ncbi:MAG: periplasmic heavy metal sensor [Rhodobacter sp.]|jgi:uncharacterized membrane protein|nr:periplasmic heavy metal sensor [Rhodobacter sp.]
MTEPEHSKTRKWRWYQYLLVLSLGANLLVVGLVGGVVLRGAPEHIREFRAANALGLRAYIRALDDESKQALIQAIAKNNDSESIGKPAIYAHLKELSAALTVQPYDSAAVAAVLARHGQVISGNVAVGHGILMYRIDAMTPEQRVEFATRLAGHRR